MSWSVYQSDLILFELLFGPRSIDPSLNIHLAGTMTFGVQNTEDEAWEQLDFFVAAGGNFIDTAEMYPVPSSSETCGRTEEIIGRWMKARGNRDKIFLASKVSGGGAETRNYVSANRTLGGRSADAPCTRLEPAQIFAAAEASLRRLQTDSLDLFQLHWPDRYAPLFGKNQFRSELAAAHVPVPFEEQVAAVGELLKSGRIKHWALSNETPYGVCKMCEVAAKLGVPPPVSIQNDFSLLDRRFENTTAEACYYYNIGLLVYGGLAGGTLTNKYNDGSELPANCRHVQFPGFQPRYHSERSRTAGRRYYELAQKKGLSLSQLALAWCKSRDYVTSVIIGATTLEHLKENIGALKIDLDKETLAEIDEIHLIARNPNVTD